MDHSCIEASALRCASIAQRPEDLCETPELERDEPNVLQQFSKRAPYSATSSCRHSPHKHKRWHAFRMRKTLPPRSPSARQCKAFRSVVALNALFVRPANDPLANRTVIKIENGPLRAPFWIRSSSRCVILVRLEQPMACLIFRRRLRETHKNRRHAARACGLFDDAEKLRELSALRSRPEDPDQRPQT